MPANPVRLLLRDNPRVVLAAGVVVCAAVVGVFALPLAGGKPTGSEHRTRPVVHAQLKLERYIRPDTGDPELLVSLPGPQFNSPDLVTGTPIVWLNCFDRNGARVIRYPYDWPLLEEYGYPPHIHQTANQRLLDRVRRCVLTGTGAQFEGAVTGKLPDAR